MTIDIIIDWLQATLRWAAPLLIVAIGEVYACLLYTSRCV